MNCIKAQMLLNCIKAQMLHWFWIGGFHSLAMAPGSDHHLLRKIRNSLGRSSGQQVPVALGYHPWL
jgi:hypothetical protein